MAEYSEWVQVMMSVVKLNVDAQQVNSSEERGGIHGSQLSILTKGVHIETREESRPK